MNYEYQCICYASTEKEPIRKLVIMRNPRKVRQCVKAIKWYYNNKNSNNR